MARLSNVIIHCSDSEWGSAAEIRRWHLGNGWDDIGYHFVILNGMIVPATKWQKELYLPLLDGMIEVGRRLDGDSLISGNEVGAHALGYNDKSIGICLIGVREFTKQQLWRGAQLMQALERVYGGLRDGILGHYQVSKNRTCPNFNVPQWVRDIDAIAAGKWTDVEPGKYKN